MFSTSASGWVALAAANCRAGLSTEFSVLACPCRLYTLACELQLDLAPTSAGCGASEAAQPSAAPPAGAVPLPVAATASRDAHAFCIAVWKMVAEHIFPVVLFMSQVVITWAIDHFESLTASSERTPGAARSPAFGAFYMPSEHVVSNAGGPPVPHEQTAFK
jgi:hypothetical protein